MSIDHLTKNQKARYWGLRVALQGLMLSRGMHFTEQEVHDIIMNVIAARH